MPKKETRGTRLLAFQILYQRSFIGIIPEGESILCKQSTLSVPAEQTAVTLANTIWENLAFVDGRISKHLHNWKQNRLAKSLNALFRLCAGEILLFPEIENNVAINDTLEICKKYVDPKAVKFCNGVLDSVLREHLQEQS